MKVVITGGSSGLGLALAQRLIQKDWEVVILDLQKPAVDVRAQFIKCDVTKDLVRVLGEISNVDVLVNNAGIASKIPFGMGEDLNDIDRVVDINLKAVCHGLHAAFQQDCKVVVNVSSMSGVVPFALDAIYTATKFGVVGLTKSLYRSQQPKVVAVCPYFVKTPLVEEIITKNSTFADMIRTGKLITVTLQQTIDAFVFAIEGSLSGQLKGGSCLLVTDQGTRTLEAMQNFDLEAATRNRHSKL